LSNRPEDILRGIVREIEASDDRISSENQHKSEIYKKAKSDGYNVKALRKVIAARRQDSAEREQNDADFDLYWTAIHGLTHAHVEIIEEFPSVPTADPAGSQPASIAEGVPLAPSAPIHPETANQSTAARKDVREVTHSGRLRNVISWDSDPAAPEPTDACMLGDSPKPESGYQAPPVDTHFPRIPHLGPVRA
jgi:uncharacterized protein (UPF0335 family)